MIDLHTIHKTIRLYGSHGWRLRRFLFKGVDVQIEANELGDLLDGVAIRDSGINAACFSRDGQNGGAVWELRYLGEPAYALLENLAEEDPDFESRLFRLKRQLTEAVTLKKSA